jgi:hypothetical protein
MVRLAGTGGTLGEGAEMFGWAPNAVRVPVMSFRLSIELFRPF